MATGREDQRLSGQGSANVPSLELGTGQNRFRAVRTLAGRGGANGFYYLAIVDYPNPAPHNNVFIHTHRKVAMDSYNVEGSGSQEVCDPAKKTYYRSDDNALHMFFLVAGTPLESKATMTTEVGTAYGNEGGRTAFVGAAQLIPEMMPKKTYRFAIERTRRYALEASGAPLRRRKDIPISPRFQRGRAADLHYDQKAYPDYFIIGDPHINFYAGTAAVTGLRLYVSGEVNSPRCEFLKVSAVFRAIIGGLAPRWGAR